MATILRSPSCPAALVVLVVVKSLEVANISSLSTPQRLRVCPVGRQKQEQSSRPLVEMA